jgi:hypothetical protein
VKPLGLEVMPDVLQPAVDASARYVKVEPSLQTIVSAPGSGPDVQSNDHIDPNTCCGAADSCGCQFTCMHAFATGGC